MKSLPPPVGDWRTRLCAGLTVCLFAAAITAPLAAWLIGGVPEDRLLPEERNSAPLPAPPRDWDSFSAYPRAFETWHGDALGLRETLLRWRNRSFVAVLGVSPTPAAYIGRDDWLFLSTGREYETQRGAAPASRFEIEAWVTALRARQRFCRARGAEYVFALVPDKTWVYPARHPLDLTPLGPTRADQLVAALGGDPVLVDLRASQRRAAAADTADDHAYFPYGSHWTDRGTAVAMEELLNALRARPGLAHLAPLAFEDVTFHRIGFSGDNWAGRLYLEGVMEQDERLVQQIRGPLATLDAARSNIAINKYVADSDDPTLPRILAFHDSFGLAAHKFLARSASHSVCLWDFFRPELVDEVAPDVVIELYVERVLSRLPFENLPEQGEFGRRVFADATEALYVFDAARDAKTLSRRGGVETEFDGEALAIRWTQPIALAELPSAALPDGAQVSVRLDIELSGPTEVNFHFLTDETRTYTRANSITRALPAGRSEIFVHLAVPNIRGPLLFRLTRKAECRLHAVESRRLR
ncbi:MAG: hypothetical protein JNL28_00930 [Planctomycetes bacterium]|nr:hypothetical protein [Planctomycetota bacterium]